jgi:hypothetical protein
MFKKSQNRSKRLTLPLFLFKCIKKASDFLKSPITLKNPQFHIFFLKSHAIFEKSSQLEKVQFLWKCLRKESKSLKKLQFL